MKKQTLLSIGFGVLIILCVINIFLGLLANKNLIQILIENNFLCTFVIIFYLRINSSNNSKKRIDVSPKTTKVSEPVNEQTVTKTNATILEKKNNGSEQLPPQEQKTTQIATCRDIKVGDSVFCNKHIFVDEVKQSILPGDKLLIKHINQDGGILVQVDKEFYTFIATVNIEDLKK